MNKLTIKVVGFYVKHENLAALKELKGSYRFDYKSGFNRYLNAIGNMEGEVTLSRSSTIAHMKQGSKNFEFNITSISDMHIPNEKNYPELQFGKGFEFRFILEPTKTRKEIEEFIK